MIRNSIIRTTGCIAVCLYTTVIVSGQCPGGNPFQTMTTTSTMVGNGNNTYSLAMFDPSIGTLFSVGMTTRFFSYYSYTLTNTNSTQENARVIVSRDDLLYATSPSNPTPIELLAENGTRQYTYTAPGSGVPPGVTNYNQTVYSGRTYNGLFEQDVVPFLGSDSLYLTYNTVTDAGVIANANNFVEISNRVSKDSVIITLTYNYCPAVTLPSSLIQLSSSSQSGNVLLGWSSQSYLTEGSYELLKSTDGRTYSSVNRQPVNRQNGGQYSYLYKPSQEDAGKTFFRVKQTDRNGNTTYSKVITVLVPKNNHTAVNAKHGMVVFPTIPVNNQIRLALPAANSRDEWKIRIISLSGNIMQEFSFTNNPQITLHLRAGLTPGMYFVNAVNSRTLESYKEKILVTR